MATAYHSKPDIYLGLERQVLKSFHERRFYKAEYPSDKVGESIRILFLNRWVGCHTGGTETHIKELASRLARRGHEVEIVTTEGDELKGYEGLVRVHYVSRNWGEPLYSRPMDPLLAYFGLLAALKMLAKLLYLRARGVKYDVISVHCTLEALLALSTRWLLRVPAVFVFEGYSDAEARIARYADLQTALSKPVVDRVYEKCGYKPLLIPIGVDTSVFKPEGERLPIPDRGSKTVVLSVCRLTPPKNIPIIVEAARIACQKDPSLLFYIVGDGPERGRIEEVIERYGLKDRVLMAGKVPQAELPRYYRSADIFVSAELSPDHFWIVVLEAIASGLAVAWTYDGTDEYLGTIENWGIPIPPKDPGKLAEVLLKLAGDRGLLENYKMRALEKARTYDWDRIIGEYERAYASAAEQVER